MTTTAIRPDDLLFAISAIFLFFYGFITLIGLAVSFEKEHAAAKIRTPESRGEGAAA